MPSPDPATEQDRRSLPSPGAARRRIAPFVVALIAAAALGAGLTAAAEGSRQVALVSLAPAPIRTLQDWSAVAVKGKVAEIFGGKFIVQDESGRALVETGPSGEGGGLVAPFETVTVQGRFERGSIHAVAISHADGRSDLLGPPGPRAPRGLLPWRGAGGALRQFFARAG